MLGQWVQLYNCVIVQCVMELVVSYGARILKDELNILLPISWNLIVYPPIMLLGISVQIPKFLP